MMKKLIILTAISLASLSLSLLAETVEIEKKITTKEPLITGALGPTIRINQFGDGVLTTAGGRINAIFKKIFLLGIGAQGGIGQTRLKIDKRQENVSLFLSDIHAGIKFFPERFFHITAQNIFGLGYLGLQNRDAQALTYVIEPELDFEVEIFSMMRVGAGLSYRFMFSPNIEVPSSKLFGLNGLIFVEFGML